MSSASSPVAKNDKLISKTTTQNWIYFACLEFQTHHNKSEESPLCVQNVWELTWMIGKQRNIGKNLTSLKQYHVRLW